MFTVQCSKMQKTSFDYKHQSSALPIYNTKSKQNLTYLVFGLEPITKN